ncbi:MAG: threonine--tRNA ligase [Clostridiales bacterium]|nr:threonine--tRNA ligase [Candidatus Apopatousia equi]
MEDKEKLEEKKLYQMMCRHTMSHVLAAAIKEVCGGHIQFGIGPAIEDGFYYDFDMEHSLVPDDFAKIEEKMHEIVEQNLPMERKEISREEALKLFADQKYKVELINDLPEDAVISIYSLGDKFMDLCKGPHVENTKVLRSFAFKINRVSGAYWRGSEKNKMMQRLYVYGFNSKDDLKEHLRLVQEALERDHRKLGKELGIFMYSDLVGRGLPMWLPNGFIVRRELSDYIMNKELALGYQHVLTPSIGSVDLYKTSGHWAHYKDDMFPSMKVDEEEYVLRPMNCPHHMMIYKNFLHSYKELPIRIAEIANDFRYEASGSLCGIERTRAFTQNDSHIFCRPEQIESEVEAVIKLILDVYKDFGFKKYTFRLSLRDKNNAEKYFGNDDLWEKSENALREILKNSGADYYEALGEAAFYGPKIDVQVQSALGHDVTLSTVQLDYQLPEKFELEYVDENDEKQRPVVIHRAILGSLDRFVAFVLEETKGALPTWLCPVQAKVMNIAESSEEYAKYVHDELNKAGIRCEYDIRNEKISYKIREATKAKIPYLLIVGDKEKENGEVSVRIRGTQESVVMKLEDLIKKISEQVKTKTLN